MKKSDPYNQFHVYSPWKAYWWLNYRAPWFNCLVLFILVAAGLGIRVLNYRPPTHNSDAQANWAAATWIVNNVPFDINFKLSRLGITVPAAAMQRAFGEDAIVYSFAPIAAFLIVLVTSYLITERLAGRVPALLVSMAILVFPEFNGSATQLLPGVFQAAYLGAMTLFLVLYFQGKRLGLYVLLAGMCLALAYMTKFTALFVVPGVGLLFFVNRINKPHIMLFCLGFLILYAGEHTFYAAKGIPGGRFQYLWHVKNTGGYSPQSHLDEIGLDVPKHTKARADARTIYSVGEVYKFFLRYTPEYAGWRWTGALIGWLVSAVYLALFAGRRFLIPVSIMGSHLLFNTFAVTNLFPLKLMTSIMSRYLDLYSGLIFVAIGLAVWHLSRRLIYGEVFLPKTSVWRKLVCVVGSVLGAVGLAWLVVLPGSKYFIAHSLRLINTSRLLFGMDITKLMFYSLVTVVLGGFIYLCIIYGPGIYTRLGTISVSWLQRQIIPFVCLGVTLFLVWPILGQNLVLARWTVPSHLKELKQEEHNIQKLNQHRKKVNKAYDNGVLIVSPHLYLAPYGGKDVVGRQSVRRAYGFYLDWEKLDSYRCLSGLTTASFKQDVAVKINGRDYWAFSKYDAATMKKMASELGPHSKVLYMEPALCTEAEFITVQQLDRRTDKYWKRESAPQETEGLILR